MIAPSTKTKGYFMRIRHALQAIGGLTCAVLLAACSSNAASSPATPTKPAARSSSTSSTAAAAPAPTTTAQMTAAVEAAQSLRAVPSSVETSLTMDDNAFPRGHSQCVTATNSANIPSGQFGGCTFGDLTSSKLMVVYGDSHAGMWAAGLESIAQRAGWKLKLFMLSGCPAPDLNFISYQTEAPNTQCTAFHAIAPPAINALHAGLVVVTSESIEQVARGVYATPAQWKTGLTATLHSLQQSGTTVTMIGDIPQWSGSKVTCLAANASNVQVCALTTTKAVSPNLSGEAGAAQSSGVTYIPGTPFVCATKCEPVINGMRVYNDEYHFTNAYVQYLSGPLQEALNLPAVSESAAG